VSDYRLIAMDVDGTILTPEGELTPRMLRAAQMAAERGVTLALATARRWTGAEPVARALGAARPLILYDGALRRAFPDGAVESTEPLAVDVAQEAAERIAANGLRVVAQYSLPAGERMVATAEAPHGDWMEAYLAFFRRQVRFRPLGALLTTFQKPLRLVSFGPLEILRALADSMVDLPAGVQILPLGSYGTAELTVFAPGVSKGAALARLAADLGLSMAETMAIGDGDNDISMLRAAGLGVAMGHAAPHVRAAADALTTSNIEDGAARAIERYALGEAPEEDDAVMAVVLEDEEEPA
jgi:Cof subfamily protein (haloacid dehalogenase superfamily)